MAILNKRNIDSNCVKEFILTTLFGEHSPDCEVYFKDSNINICMLGGGDWHHYHTNLNKDNPFNDIYLYGVNKFGMILQVRYIPEDFKIYNRTNNQLFIKEIVNTDLKGELGFENVYLDLLGNMNFNRIKDIPEILSKKLENVTSIHFGETGGIFIRCLNDFKGDYKSQIFNMILREYYNFKHHLNQLSHIQLFVNVAAVGEVMVYLDFQDSSKCYFV